MLMVWLRLGKDPKSDMAHIVALLMCCMTETKLKYPGFAETYNANILFWAGPKESGYCVHILLTCCVDLCIQHV